MDPLLLLPDAYSRLLLNPCPLCGGLLEAQNALKHCLCNSFAHPACILQYLSHLSHPLPHASPNFQCIQCHHTLQVTHKASRKYQMNQLVKANKYLLILMVTLSSCIFFGIDTVIFISRRNSVTGSNSVLGLLVSATLLMGGLVWYVFSCRRKTQTKLVGVAGRVVDDEVSAFQGMSDSVEWSSQKTLMFSE